MSRHKWGAFERDAQGRYLVDNGVPCERQGCPVRRRMKLVALARERPQYSIDGGQSWGGLKTGFSVRVPECRGGSGVRLSRTTEAGTTYAASFSEEPSREVVEALDQVADAARELLARGARS